MLFNVVDDAAGQLLDRLENTLNIIELTATRLEANASPVGNFIEVLSIA